MRTEKVLWALAVLCAVYLLSGPFLGGRTVWSHRGWIISDGAGWDWLMPAAGIVALGGLVIGVALLPRVAIPVFGAAIAMVAFAIAAYASGSAWIDLLQGTTRLQASLSARGEQVEVLYPSQPQSFAVVATVATGFALVLVISWLKPSADEW
jgi:hypothetical protein